MCQYNTECIFFVYDISQNKDQHIMKPCKLNIQSQILCQIFYALASFDSNHIHLLRSKLCMSRKGSLTLKQEVLVFFSESVFHSICLKPLLIDYYQLIIMRYRLIGQLWNHLYAEIFMCLTVWFAIRSKSRFIQNTWIEHTNIQQSEEYFLPSFQHASRKVCIF